MFHEGIYSHWKVTFRYYLLCEWWRITHSSVLSRDLTMNIQLLITIRNPRCSAILRLWYSATVIQMNQSERGCSTTHVTHNLKWWDRSSSTCVEWRRKSVFGNRTVNQFQTFQFVRRDMTTYSSLGLKYQMAEEDEGKETKFSEPSRMTIMLKKT